MLAEGKSRRKLQVFGVLKFSWQLFWPRLRLFFLFVSFFVFVKFDDIFKMQKTWISLAHAVLSALKVNTDNYSSRLIFLPTWNSNDDMFQQIHLSYIFLFLQVHVLSNCLKISYCVFVWTWSLSICELFGNLALISCLLLKKLYQEKRDALLYRSQ